MKVRVLGCSGGIGGRHLHTTAMLVDHDILIDAGTGLLELSLSELAMIDHVFLTHSHLDHIAGLPLLLDAVADRRQSPILIYALEATLEILKNHIFNWAIWPDFSEICICQTPVMQYQNISLDQTLVLGGRKITVLPAKHTVPAVGYLLDSGAASLAFTGDTTTQEAFWERVNQVSNLRYLVIETAFSNAEEKLATVSQHLSPNLLSHELAKLRSHPSIYVSHLKPGQMELIMSEIENASAAFSPKMLQNNHLFEF